MQNETTPNRTGKAVAGLVLGIVGMIAWFIPIFGLPITIVGLILSIKGMGSTKRGMAVTGLVLCIIGLVLSIINMSIGAYMGATGRHPYVANHHVGVTYKIITDIDNAIKTFERHTGSYPKSLDELAAPIGGKRPLLSQRKLNDAWGTPILLKFNGSSYEIRSAGQDRQMDTPDDILLTHSPSATQP